MFTVRRSKSIVLKPVSPLLTDSGRHRQQFASFAVALMEGVDPRQVRILVIDGSTTAPDFGEWREYEHVASNVPLLMTPDAAHALTSQGFQRTHVINADQLFAMLSPFANVATLTQIERTREVEKRHHAFQTWLATFLIALQNLAAQSDEIRERLIEWLSVAEFDFSSLLIDVLRQSVGSDLVDWATHHLQPVSGKRALAFLDADGEAEECSTLRSSIHRVFGPSGPLARSVPGYERRWAQVELAELVGNALEQRDLLLAEAGTGVGKSLGYLVPSLLWANETGGKIVVSTHTKSLQDQLYRKDLPEAVKAVSAECHASDVRTSILRGRANYLCKSRWESVSSLVVNEPEMAALFTRIALWITVTETGDLSELPFTSDERRRIRGLTALTENCSPDHCRALQGNRCFLTRARNRARTANLLLVNHALLLTELAADGYVLAGSDGLIIDEAHHLEHVATDQLGFRVNHRNIEALVHEFAELKGQSIEGIAPVSVRFLQSAADSSVKAESLSWLRDGVMLGQSVIQSTKQFFDRLETIAADSGESSANRQRHRIQSADRSLPSWSDLEISWELVASALQPLQDIGLSLLKSLLKLTRNQDSDEGALSSVSALESWLDRVVELVANANGLVHHHDTTKVCWIETFPSHDRTALCSAPIRVGDNLTQMFDLSERAVILTSATLTSSNSFALLRHQLSLDDGTESVLPSPYDQRDTTLLVLPDGAPEPSTQSYGQYVADAIVEVATAVGGKTLALFTSIAALRAAAMAVKEPLQGIGIGVLAQDVDGPAPELAARLRRGDKVVVLGASTFWEGVDIQGSGLSALVITRLPFDVPTDPIFAARAEEFDNPFMEYSLPRAVLRFRQGFGRLIRSQTDTGVVVVLDNRIVSKRYGRKFLNGLPPTQVHFSKPCEFGSISQRWLESRDMMNGTAS